MASLSRRKVSCGMHAVLACTLGSTAMELMAMPPIHVPLSAQAWATTGDVQFQQKEAFPQGLMILKAGKSEAVFARLKDMAFANGTIEFDVKPVNEEWPTIRFRQRDTDTAEEFYIRPGPDCSVAIDCLQYAPTFRGRMLWDSYYQYQSAAPFRDNEWNHVKLIVSGRRMDVYINGTDRPALAVDELQGDTQAGSIEFQGPATFTNIVITPGAVHGLSPIAKPDPTAADKGYVRHWQVLAPTALAMSAEPTAVPAFDAQANGMPIRAERLGLVNLARRFDPVVTRTTPYYAWLKASVHASHAQVKHVRLGYLRMASVFINGKLVFRGKNLYNDASERKAPDGRLGLENGSFDVPLEKGDNQIMIALRSNTPEMGDHYSYGFAFHFDDPDGLTMQP